MYVLHAPDRTTLDSQTQLFAEHMEPLLVTLDAARCSGRLPLDLPELGQYAEVCRWPFRRLEYSFALQHLIASLKPGDRYLDAGCGVTPLAHALARRGVRSDACDGDGSLMERLQRFDPCAVYGSKVTYATQNLVSTTYPDETFDAVSCVSVLEHIPPPHDQSALRELIRITKPGGVLVLTVDFIPPTRSRWNGRWRHSLSRAASMARRGEFAEIGSALMRKRQARAVVLQGQARCERSANQCFEVQHLEQDLLPLLIGPPEPAVRELRTHLGSSADLRALTPAHAHRFWGLEEGLFEKQGRRTVLPAAGAFRRSTVAVYGKRSA